jgi:hypothetical protein
MSRLYMEHYHGEVTVTRDSYLNKMQVVHIGKYMQIKFKIIKCVINLDVRICAIKSNLLSNIYETLFNVMGFEVYLFIFITFLRIASCIL